MACYKLEMSSTACRTLEVSTESSSLVQSSEAHLSTGDTYHLSLARLSDEKGLVCFQRPGLAELVMFLCYLMLSSLRFLSGIYREDL